jgi:thioredoxin-related protein
MKKHTLQAGLAAIATFLFMAFMPINPMLEIGDAAPLVTRELKNVDKTMHSLESLKKENGLLVIFSCNTCPFVVGNGDKSEGWENRYNELYDWSSENNIGMVLVNSNEAKREEGDSFEDMVARSKEYQYKSPYVLDKNSELADAFGALTTPHVYLFDKDLKLVYRGAIDDNVNRKAEVSEFYLRDALLNLSANKAINTELTKQLGCSIKRVK